MSSVIWTPAALASELRSFIGLGWRLVEAQHQVSTLALVETLDEQQVLESLIENTKPEMPAACRALDYLLATPFRYETEYPKGSRFRRAGKTLGVFYAAEHPETAVAEMAFYRLLFFAESPDTSWPENAMEYTAFAAAIDTDRAVSLVDPPLNRDRDIWVSPTDYEACQALAEICRDAGAEAIIYESVRDPSGGRNLAVLACEAFSAPAPVDRQTWRLRLSRSGVQAIREFPIKRLEFAPEAFSADPRIAAFNWDRA